VPILRLFSGESGTRGPILSRFLAERWEATQLDFRAEKGREARLPSIEEDLYTVAEQNVSAIRKLQPDTAWAVGSALRADALARQAA